MLKALQYANLGLAFLLELCALAALCFWGFSAGDGVIMKIALGIGAPLLMIIVWGLLLAPTSPRRPKDPALFVLKLIILGAAASGVAASNQPALAVLLIVLFLINYGLAKLWGQE